MPRKKSPGSGVDYHTLAEFRYEIRRFINFSEQIVRAVGLEPQQHQALLAIKGLPAHCAPTVGVLAERLLIQHHSAVELMNRLEAKGLIRRARGAADRRSVLLALTSQGEKLLRRLALVHRVEMKTARAKLLEALTNVIGHDGSGRAAGTMRRLKISKRTRQSSNVAAKPRHKVNRRKP
jgi:DNA-binding MarR family transcriptional regulator